MKQLSKLLLLLCCCSLFVQSSAQSDSGMHKDRSSEYPQCASPCTCGMGIQTPLGVNNDHIHEKGEWMISYTLMNMSMRGNQSGATPINSDVVYQQYMMVPESMSMNMHMVMAMYGLTDRLTLMAMGGFVANSMTMTMAPMSMPGMVMSEDMVMLSTSSGISDTRLSALYSLSHSDKQRIIGSLGANLPTGTIKATGVTMLGENQRLPYNMQPGTGSFSLLPGITYVRQYNSWAWGFDAGADLKLNNNALGYRFGNVYRTTTWVAYRFLSFVSGSIRFEGIATDKISGTDPQMNIDLYRQYDLTTVAGNYGGRVASAYLGLNFHLKQATLDKFNLLAEYGMPMYQYRNGTQMALRSDLLVGLQYKL